MQEKKKVSSSSAVNAVGTYSLGEEIANAVTHGLAVLLSIAGLVLMIIFAVRQSAGALAIVSTSIFGASMIILYGLDALPRDSESACQTCAAGIGPQCDLHPDCGELYAVLSDYARRHHGHCALLGGVDHCTFWGMLSALAFKSGGLAQLRALPRARLVHCVCCRTFD